MAQRNLRRLLPANCLQQNKRFLLLKKKLFLVCGLQRKGEHICEADVSRGQTTKLWQCCWAPKEFIGREWVSPAGLLLFTAQVLCHAADCLSHLLLPVSSHLTSDADLEMVAQISAAMSSLPVADFHSACSTWPELLALLSQIQSVLSASIKSLAPYYNIYNELSTLSNYVLRGSLHHVQWDLQWLQ